MKHTFEETIYQTGVNWCVDVPVEITNQMIPNKGRIKVNGTINGFGFEKNLVPVKNRPYRLFVNLIMMKGGKTALGKTALFEIEQNFKIVNVDYPMPKILIEHLKMNDLITEFNNLTSSRKKAILKYLNNIKGNDTMLKNLNKLIFQLKNKEKNVRIP